MKKGTAYRKELEKHATHQHMSCRRTAAIFGKGRSLIPALPLLQAFTDLMVSFVVLHHHSGWDPLHPTPITLSEQVREAKELLTVWSGRKFLSPTEPSRRLH